MTINSTKFQQNVGYYFKLAEGGMIVNILKSKPKKSLFQLTAIPIKENSKDKARLKKFFKKLEAQNAKFDFYGGDPVKFVREIRE